MNQRDIRSAIYLSGIKPIGYVVHHDIPGEVMALNVPSVSVGNAIVRALRNRQKLVSKGVRANGV